MKRQWHPPFYEMMRLLLSDWYTVQTEVPVSELPRAGDMLLLRKDKADPPFKGIWSHLVEYNLIEFKGPTDAAEEEDLELMMAVGCGLTVKINEERRAAKQAVLQPNQVGFWLVAPKLSDEFIFRSRLRTSFTAHQNGFWTGTGWRHPVRLLSYRDAAVEVDALPFFLVDGEKEPPAGVAPLLLGRQDLREKFKGVMELFQPDLAEELKNMARDPNSIIDWEKVGKYNDLGGAAKLIPMERIIAEKGADEVARAVGIPGVIQAVGEEAAVADLLKVVPYERLLELLKKKQEGK